MSELYNELKAALPPGLVVPEAIKLLYDWIEEQGNIVGNTGTLFLDQGAEWSDKGRPGWTHIEFSTHRNEDLGDWFGHKKCEMLDRICVFAQTGGDGSLAAFWLDDDGRQVIVHMGSGSGSTLCCVLAEDPVDFLRLLAIGYDEISNEYEFGKAPNSDPRFLVQPNTQYQQWVKETFNVTIPAIALEIVQHPDSMDDNNSVDRFARWVRTGWEVS